MNALRSLDIPSSTGTCSQELRRRGYCTGFLLVEVTCRCAINRTHGTASRRPRIRHRVKNFYGSVCAKAITRFGPAGRRCHLIPFLLFLGAPSVSERYTHDVVALAACGFDSDSLRDTEERPSTAFRSLRVIIAAMMKLMLDPVAR